LISKTVFFLERHGYTGNNLINSCMSYIVTEVA